MQQIKIDRINSFYRKMEPINNRYICKSRMYKASFKDTRITNVNFKGSIITCTSFKNAKIEKCEFFGTNLRDCNFSDAKLKDCVFVAAKLVGCNFKNASFENVLFVTQRMDLCKNLDPTGISIVNRINAVKMSSALKEVLDNYHNNSRDVYTHLIKFGPNRYNYLHISMMLEKISEEKVISFLDGLHSCYFKTIYELMDVLN